MPRAGCKGRRNSTFIREMNPLPEGWFIVNLWKLSLHDAEIWTNSLNCSAKSLFSNWTSWRPWFYTLVTNYLLFCLPDFQNKKLCKAAWILCGTSEKWIAWLSLFTISIKKKRDLAFRSFFKLLWIFHIPRSVIPSCHSCIQLGLQ